MRLSNWVYPAEHASVWTGAMISESGEILTTSGALWDALVVDVQIADGTQGQACVTGRDDYLALALLKPLLEPRAYDFAELSGAAPVVGDRLGLLQHTSFSSALDQRTTSVSEYRSDSSGYGYDFFQIQAADTTSDGAVLINPYSQGQIQGIRMPSLWLLVWEIASPGEVWAVDALSIASTALPVLRSGRMNIDIYHPSYGPYDSPPPRIPVVFHGSITVDGAPAPVGSVLYARVSKEGQPSYWEEGPAVYESGSFIIEVAAPYYDPVYDGATIEFWMDCRRSSTTAVYNPPVGGISGIIELDLAF